MAQTPQQRRANEAYAKSESSKRGRAASDVPRKMTPSKSPVSQTWVLVLVFVLCGAGLFEVLRLFFDLGSGLFGSP